MRSGLIDLVLCVRGHGGGGNRLGCRPRRRGGGCVGTQEASGALRAEHLGGLPVEEHVRPETRTALTVSTLRLTIRDIAPYWSTFSSV
jgi:hypothetical protein